MKEYVLRFCFWINKRFWISEALISHCLLVKKQHAIITLLVYSPPSWLFHIYYTLIVCQHLQDKKENKKQKSMTKLDIKKLIKLG